MKLSIDIVVSLPKLDGDKNREFVEGVLAVFRATFPEAVPLDPKGDDYVPPVTVSFHSEDETH